MTPFGMGHIFLSLCSPRPQVLRKEQALSEDSGFLKEQMEKLLKVCASLNIHTLNILHTVVSRTHAAEPLFVHYPLVKVQKRDVQCIT